MARQRAFEGMSVAKTREQINEWVREELLDMHKRKREADMAKLIEACALFQVDSEEEVGECGEVALLPAVAPSRSSSSPAPSSSSVVRLVRLIVFLVLLLFGLLLRIFRTRHSKGGGGGGKHPTLKQRRPKKSNRTAT